MSSAGSGDGGAYQRNAADVVFSAEGADVVFTETQFVLCLSVVPMLA